MASGEKHVRLNNIKKAREVWRLKIDGIDSSTIASQLSITTATIAEILKYTVFDHYTPLIKKPSYYDEQLLIKQKISLERKKLTKIMDSIAHKKKIFYILLQATVVIVVVLMVI